MSHTFFLKEVLGVRERGLIVEVASINAPDRPRGDLPPVEAAEADRTFYVKAGGNLFLAWSVLATVVRNPGVALRGLRAALLLGGLDLKSRAFALFYLAEALLVGRWLRRNSLEHLHVHFGGAVATVGMLTSAAWQIPWSVTLHGPDEFFDQEAFYLRQKIESASFVVCISDFCRSQVLRVSPTTQDDRLEVVRLGVDCTALRPRVTKPGPTNQIVSGSSNPVRIVCTGRMVAAKGHRILLEAVAGMISAGFNLSLVLIGDGPERKSLEMQSARQGIAKNVRFTGAMAHEPTLVEVSQADIFVLASFAEGLPVALMEAMALGIPCVSTTIAAIPELILSGQNGMLVPPANPGLLQNALKKMAANADERRRLGMAARSTVESQYNLAVNLDQLAGMWKRRLRAESAL